MATDNNVSRRGFITALLGVPILGAVATTGVALGQYVYPPASLTTPAAPKVIGKVGQLAVNEALKFDFDDLPALLVKKTDGDSVENYLAYSLKCTHLGCTVQVPNMKAMEPLFCPCHGGQYTVDGVNIPGTPPPKRLPLYEIKIEGEEIICVGLAKEKEA